MRRSTEQFPKDSNRNASYLSRFQFWKNQVTQWTSEDRFRYVRAVDRLVSRRPVLNNQLLAEKTISIGLRARF